MRDLWFITVQSITRISGFFLAIGFHLMWPAQVFHAALSAAALRYFLQDSFLFLL